MTAEQPAAALTRAEAGPEAQAECAATDAGERNGDEKGATPAPPSAPLVIDLDGTLVCTNMLIECALSLIKQNPLAAFQMLAWLSKGRAHLKQELARRVPIDTAALPINAHVKAYGAGEKSRGRQVYLATAADRSIAQPIADHCGFFDGVLASDGRVNLKGERKAEALGRLFPAGFAYAGDSRADIPIWARASEIILVGASRWTRRAVEQLGKPTYSFPTPSRLGALIACARPHQWAKNSLVFVPAILSGAINAPHVLLATALSFAALCLVASSTYIINDLWDVADDRKHWSKRHRPIASGALPMSTALIASPVGLAAGLLLAMTAAPAALGVLLVYLVLTLAYSFAVKRVPVLDVTTLAGLFTLRLVLGIVSADVFASPWLLVFSMFLFSSLCFAKRYVEIQGTASRGQAAIASRGYRAEDAPLLFSLGLGAGISSIAIMVLYIMFDAFQRTFYGNTAWLWVFPLTLFLWISRVWLLAGRGQLHDDPVAFAVGDTVSLLLGCAMFAAFLLAWSGVFA